MNSGQLGIFTNGYWGHKAYALPAEVNLLGTAHYLEALEWQKEIVKIHTIFGGKNPHPNYLVGGAPCSINIDDSNALNIERLSYVGTLLDQAEEFIEQVYIPDLLAIASFYKNWAAIGSGLSNYLSYGDLPTNGYANPEKYKFPRGIILDRNLQKIHDVDVKDLEQIQENITHSWYKYGKGGGDYRHPWNGETKLNYTGSKPPYEHLDVRKKYSWLKTPRWKGRAMEVGPLSRVLVAYAQGNREVKEIVNGALRKLNVPLEALFSTIGRTAARGLETQLVAGWAKEFHLQLLANIKNGDTRTFNNEKWEPDTWPAHAKGVGMSEAPRGALAHCRGVTGVIGRNANHLLRIAGARPEAVCLNRQRLPCFRPCSARGGRYLKLAS